MPYHHLEELLSAELAALEGAGRLKGKEAVIAGIVPPKDGKGLRYLLEGEGEKPFLRMNSNSYLGLPRVRALVEAEEAAVRAFGTGPGAVRFISGTWAPHVELERRLAAFHGREAAMIYNSAYATVMGVLPPLISPETAVISDELNHNCIINAMRLARPKEKYVYRHLDLNELEERLKEASGNCRRAIVVTDGIFSMRGDHAPLPGIVELARKYNQAFPENVLVVVDDSHGVGAFGATGRGTEEYTGCGQVDLLVATLGKAFGVNGGYVVAGKAVIDYLRETSPFYVYSNPLTELGLETIPGEHPVVPLMVRDTAKTSALVTHLRKHGVLATGLNYPVVPKGDEEIRFQISADHTPADLDEALAVLANSSL